MKRPLVIPSPDTIGPDTPLRLSVAAALAFPGGGMTASGLRKERDRGRLVVEMIAGKEFTTLTEIAKMRALCRVERASASPAMSFRAQSVVKSPTEADAQLALARVRITIARLKRHRAAPIHSKDK